ncbi:MAG: hypothetical protein NTV44_03025 [Firmicutes bacterium]|nr:hypothetical protein [Bacillota bacterium]
MSIISEVLEEELQRILRMQKVYQKELSSLKQGNLIFRKLPHSNNEYLYLARRVDGKVKQLYLGQRNEVNIESLQKELMESKKIKASIKELSENEEKLRKALGNL